MTTETTTRQILNINETHEVASYPYGRLRTKAFFSIEFVAKKGFRNVFQTIDPKSGRLNAPKKSTYSLFAFQTKDENGFIRNGSLGPSLNNEQINKFTNFIYTNKDSFCLTPEMVKFIAVDLIGIIKAGLVWADGNKKAMFETLKPELDKLVQVANTGDIELLNGFKIDVETIENIKNSATEDEKVKLVAKTYQVIDNKVIYTAPTVTAPAPVEVVAPVAVTPAPAVSPAVAPATQLGLFGGEKTVRTAPATQLSLF